jgi:hypothetical protein
MRIFGRILKWAAIFLVALLVLSAFGMGFLLDVPFRLAFGWIGFLNGNLAMMKVNPLLLAEAAVCVAALGIGGHWFARWLCREMADDAPVPWRPRWTIAGLGGVLLLFVAGIATIGITHQAAWLFTAKGPLIEDAYSARTRVSEAILSGSALKSAITESYQKTGRLPASAAEAGLSEPFQPTPHAKALSVGAGGVIRVEVPESLSGGGEITLTPSSTGETLAWTCRSTLPPKVLPSACGE